MKTYPTFRDGLRTHWLAFKLIHNAPGVLRMVLPPVLITTVIAVPTAWHLYHKLLAMVPAYVTHLRGVGVLASFLVLVGMMIMTGVASTFVYSVLSLPFEERIASDVERELFPDRLETPPGRGFINGFANVAATSMLMLAALVFFFLVSFVPLVGPPVGLIGSAMVVGFGYMMGAADLRWEDLWERLTLIQSAGGAVIGFGLPIVILGQVPLLNVLIFPIYVVGGTLLYNRIRGNFPEEIGPHE